jgi:hypothetical protein
VIFECTQELEPLIVAHLRVGKCLQHEEISKNLFGNEMALSGFSHSLEVKIRVAVDFVSLS